MKHNIPALVSVLGSEQFRAGHVHTGLVGEVDRPRQPATRPLKEHSLGIERRGKSEVTGSVWKIVAEVGQRLEPGDTIMIIESMKMEIPVIAEEGGTLSEFLVEEDDGGDRRPDRGGARGTEHDARRQA